MSISQANLDAKLTQQQGRQATAVPFIAMSKTTTGRMDDATMAWVVDVSNTRSALASSDLLCNRLPAPKRRCG